MNTKTKSQIKFWIFQVCRAGFKIADFVLDLFSLRVLWDMEENQHKWFLMGLAIMIISILIQMMITVIYIKKTKEKKKIWKTILMYSFSLLLSTVQLYVYLCKIGYFKLKEKIKDEKEEMRNKKMTAERKIQMVQMKNKRMKMNLILNFMTACDLFFESYPQFLLQAYVYLINPEMYKGKTTLIVSALFSFIKLLFMFAYYEFKWNKNEGENIDLSVKIHFKILVAIDRVFSLIVRLFLFLFILAWLDFYFLILFICLFWQLRILALIRSNQKLNIIRWLTIVCRVLFESIPYRSYLIKEINIKYNFTYFVRVHVPALLESSVIVPLILYFFPDPLYTPLTNNLPLQIIKDNQILIYVILALTNLLRLIILKYVLSEYNNFDRDTKDDPHSQKFQLTVVNSQQYKSSLGNNVAFRYNSIVTFSAFNFLLNYPARKYFLDISDLENFDSDSSMSAETGLKINSFRNKMEMLNIQMNRQKLGYGYPSGSESVSESKSNSSYNSNSDYDTSTNTNTSSSDSSDSVHYDDSKNQKKWWCWWCWGKGKDKDTERERKRRRKRKKNKNKNKKEMEMKTILRFQNSQLICKESYIALLTIFLSISTLAAILYYPSIDSSDNYCYHKIPNIFKSYISLLIFFPVTWILQLIFEKKKYKIVVILGTLSESFFFLAIYSLFLFYEINSCKISLKSEFEKTVQFSSMFTLILYSTFDFISFMLLNLVYIKRE
ncbi:xk-related protein [Anaeramoeba flamelloides]|uniref:Xk-related protein n=1 Tax=Anaeramoeba flamelloides TaxID=1746091 RepID=A0ABQ8XTU9_9EUKA|nr:xk-related protein [Anaeramoeba flamelloides]